MFVCEWRRLVGRFVARLSGKSAAVATNMYSFARGTSRRLEAPGAAQIFTEIVSSSGALIFALLVCSGDSVRTVIALRHVRFRLDFDLVITDQPAGLQQGVGGFRAGEIPAMHLCGFFPTRTVAHIDPRADNVGR